MTHLPIWYGVSSGRLIDISRPSLEDIAIEDIAYSLAHMLRFNGHLKHPISVARHSIYVAELVCEHCKFAALLHDAHEAYLGDITRPLKQFLRLGGVDVDDLEKLWQHQIWKKYGCLPLNLNEEQCILEADDLQLAREIVCYAHEGPFQDKGRCWLDESTYSAIAPLPVHRFDPDQDFHDFLKCFEDLYTLDYQADSM